MLRATLQRILVGQLTTIHGDLIKIVSIFNLMKPDDVNTGIILYPDLEKIIGSINQRIAAKVAVKP